MDGDRIMIFDMWAPLRAGVARRLALLNAMRDGYALAQWPSLPRCGEDFEE